jgi:multidrug efflux pump subunit AcrA (membrane-fusion protein)
MILLVGLTAPQPRSVLLRTTAVRPASPVQGIIVAAAAAAALAGAGVFVGLRSGTGAEESEADAVSETIAPSAAQGFATDVAIPVAGAPVVRETLTIGVSAAGQAEAWRRAVVTAQVAGRVVSVPVRENDAVGAGRLLVGIDAAEYQLAVVDAAAKFREMTLVDERIKNGSGNHPNPISVSAPMGRSYHLVRAGKRVAAVCPSQDDATARYRRPAEELQGARSRFDRAGGPGAAHQPRVTSHRSAG